MSGPSTTPAAVRRPLALRISADGGALGAWTLGAAVVLYLSLRGGGYDAIVHSEVGIALWWVVLLGCAVGILPVRRLGRGATAGIALLGAFVAWSALSALWSESSERSIASAGLVATYVGAFALGAAVVRRGTARHLVHGVASAVAVVGILALLSRLHRAWFPHNAIGDFLPDARSRLAYPVNYWNGLAALLALGIPLLADLAVRARSLLGQAAAAGAIPALGLALYLTLSRGGAIELGVGLLVTLVFVRPRASAVATVLGAGGGAAILIAAAGQRAALRGGADSALAHQQGNQLVAYVVFVVLGVALIQAAVGLLARAGAGPWGVTVPRRGARTAVVAAVGAGVVAFAALGGPHAISHAWHDFKNPTAGLQGGANQTAARFSSTSGNGRYQYWSSAGQAWSKHRLAGIGAGSWELWWDRHADLGGHVVNAHSLYMETLAETGLVGLALLAAFLALLLAVAIRRARAGDAGAAGAAGAIAAFCVAGAVDWVWQLPAIPVAALLLGGAMLARDTAAPRGRSRLALGVLAVVALAVIVVPMAATAALRRSQQDARASRLGPALQQALSAGQVQPYAASPLLQRALILEQAGDLAQAARVAQTAERKEPTNWEPAFVRARIESERGNVGAALAAFRRARTLNRTSNLLGSTR